MQVVQLIVEVLQLGLLAVLVGAFLRFLATFRARATAEESMERAAVAAQEVDLAEQRQKLAPRHHIEPAVFVGEGWVTRCECTWTSRPRDIPSDALDEAEAHLAAMPRRRAG